MNEKNRGYASMHSVADNNRDVIYHAIFCLGCVWHTGLILCWEASEKRIPDITSATSPGEKHSTLVNII